MKQLLQDFDSGDLRLEDVPPPNLNENGILVQNHWSCVSAGTEKAVISLAKKNLLNKARQRPDLAKQVIEKARTDGLLSTYKAVKGRLEQPSALGYSCAGEVVAVGENVTEFAEGDRVACGGADYANHAEMVYVPENLAVSVPDEVALSDAAFVTVGAIAMQGIRRAELTPGERVAVVGLGLIGQLTVQILTAYGFPVLGLDINPGQVEKGFANGMDAGAVIDEDPEGAAEAFSDGHGVDAVIITASTDSDQPIEMAGDLSRERGRVSVVGQVGMDVPRNAYYEKELDVNISRSYGPGRYDKTYEEKGLSYPIDQVRWTENRNMAEFLRLIAAGRVVLDDIVTHRFDFADALNAYDLILENPDGEDFTGVLLEYDTDQRHKSRVEHRTATSKAGVDGPVSVGLVGGGNFARTTLLPIFVDLDGVSLHAVASNTGKTAADIARSHDCAYSTTDYEELLDDDAIDLVVVATRHDTHAEIATAALSVDKNVHLEKPMALSTDELRDVVSAERNSIGRLLVGYNRRFAPSTETLRESLSTATGPFVATYRVHADDVPPDHWVHDPEEGGGRIVGEVCHFVDFLQSLTETLPERVYASTIDSGGAIVDEDNVSIVVDMADGSTGVIQYLTVGSSSEPKEQISVSRGGRTEHIENFKSGALGIRQKKGHRQEIEKFTEAIRTGEQSPIPMSHQVATTLATFRIREAITSGESLSIDIDQFLVD